MAGSWGTGVCRLWEAGARISRRTEAGERMDAFLPDRQREEPDFWGRRDVRVGGCFASRGLPVRVAAPGIRSFAFGRLRAAGGRARLDCLRPK